MPKIHIRNATEGQRAVVDASGKQHVLQPGQDARLDIAPGTNLLGFENLGGRKQQPALDLTEATADELKAVIAAKGGKVPEGASDADLLKLATELSTDKK